MDSWSEVDPVSNLNLKGKRGEKTTFSPIFGNFGHWVELKREMRETPHSLYDIWRSGGRNPLSKDLKFIYSTRATRRYR